uniref:Uncharacterized protein n=1 Tax=Arion vulgaris TaxID=1028688 RepID=A0A0B7A413_9EUPU
MDDMIRKWVGCSIKDVYDETQSERPSLMNDDLLYIKGEKKFVRTKGERFCSFSQDLSIFLNCQKSTRLSEIVGMLCTLVTYGEAPQK